VKALALLLLLVAAPASATDLSVLGRFSSEPNVRALQRAAARLAEVHPERVRSWLRRAGKAALLPTIRVRVGRGLGALSRDTSSSLVLTTTDDWRFEVEATWSLDRLVFDRNELRAGWEAQRVARRREELLTHVAQLYYARRRLQVDAVLAPDAPGALDRALEIEELTAVLDGLTDGALSRGNRHP
jgi:hypothetical protein